MSKSLRPNFLNLPRLSFKVEIELFFGYIVIILERDVRISCFWKFPTKNWLPWILKLDHFFVEEWKTLTHSKSISISRSILYNFQCDCLICDDFFYDINIDLWLVHFNWNIIWLLFILLLLRWVIWRNSRNLFLLLLLFFLYFLLISFILIIFWARFSTSATHFYRNLSLSISYSFSTNFLI